MPKTRRQGSQRITLPKRNISNAPDGSLAGGMGMNAPQIENIPGVTPNAALTAYAQSIQMQSKAVPQRTVNSLGLITYGNPFSANAYRPPTPSVQFNQPNQPLGVASFIGGLSSNFAQTLTSANQVNQSSSMFAPIADVGDGGRPKGSLTDSNFNFNARIIKAELDKALPNVLTLSDAIRLGENGLTVDEIKASYAEMGYQYVPSSQGGLFRYVGAGTQSADGTTPIGNAPGSGYTWSNGAWHAPEGEDPYSDKKTVFMSKNRGWVTPEVANLLNRKRRRRQEETRNRLAQERAASTQPSQTPSTGGEAQGLVNFRVGFG